jgi:DNA-binding transcriptional LysR family regulator
LETRYLRSLIAVVDTGSIADAARQEHLTAAAVGQRVQALERELGFALLSRSGHAARPTQACLALLPRARRLVREAALLGSDASADGLAGTLRIGAISTALTGMLPAALRKLTQAAPQCRPVIVPGTSRALYQMQLAGELDAAILVAPPFALPKALRSVQLRSEPLVLLAPPHAHGRPATLLRSLPTYATTPMPGAAAMRPSGWPTRPWSPPCSAIWMRWRPSPCWRPTAWAWAWCRAGRAWSASRATAACCPLQASPMSAPSCS